MDNQFEPLMSGEVLSIDNPEQFPIGHKTFKVSEFVEALKKEFVKQNVGGLSEEQIGWLTEAGIECQALKFGASGWQKGKIRISLEFLPEESGVVKGEVASESKQLFDDRERSTANFSPDFESTLVEDEEVIDWEDDGLDLETISKNIDEELELVENSEKNPFDEEEFETNDVEEKFLEGFAEDSEFDFPSFALDEEQEQEEDAETEVLNFEDIWQDVSQYRS